MFLTFMRWLARNFSALLLAFILAVVVWISAVVTADPNEEKVFGPVNIERIGQDSSLLLVSEISTQARLTLRAPQSIWRRLDSDANLVHAWIDLSGLGPGEHTVAVRARVDASPIRLLQIEPQEIHLILEPLVALDFPVQLAVEGELPLGYKKGAPVLEPITVTVSGPESAVTKIDQVRVRVDVSGAIETFKRSVAVQAVDANGNAVTNVTIVPKAVMTTQPISLLGGFKNVVVRVVTKGQVANGYRLTNILVSPPTVTLFSDNPQLVDDIPGYVDTLPVDLSNLSDDIEMNVGLNLADGITLVREPSVLVQVSVAAIEGSLTLSLPIDVIGLSPGTQASISPAMVDVIVAGPLNILDTLSASSFRVVLDLTGLPPGVYQRSPTVDLSPDLVRVQTTLPETVEVTIEATSTETPVSPDLSTPEATVAP